MRAEDRQKLTRAARSAEARPLRAWRDEVRASRLADRTDQVASAGVPRGLEWPGVGTATIPAGPFAAELAEVQLEQALAVVRVRPGITTVELARALGLSPRWLDRILPSWIAAGVVVYDGLGWRVVEPASRELGSPGDRHDEGA